MAAKRKFGWTKISWEQRGSNQTDFLCSFDSVDPWDSPWFGKYHISFTNVYFTIEDMLNQLRMVPIPLPVRKWWVLNFWSPLSLFHIIPKVIRTESLVKAHLNSFRFRMSHVTEGALPVLGSFFRASVFVQWSVQINQKKHSGNSTAFAVLENDKFNSFIDETTWHRITRPIPNVYASNKLLVEIYARACAEWSWPHAC